MFSNVSARWRRRLRVAVVVWAVLLLAAAFAGTRATVKEQIDASEAREAMDGILGEAAASLTGAAVLAAGPLEANSCEVTPVRSGLSLTRTLQVSGATKDQVEALADRYSLTESSDELTASWTGETDGYLTVTVTAEGADPVGGRWAEPVLVQVTTGCRPDADGVTTFSPDPPLDATAAWEYGAVPCPGGGTLSSWTEAVEAEPFQVWETTGGCA